MIRKHYTGLVQTADGMWQENLRPMRRRKHLKNRHVAHAYMCTMRLPKFTIRSRCQLPARIPYSQATHRLAGPSQGIVHIEVVRAASAVPAALEVCQLVS